MQNEAHKLNILEFLINLLFSAFLKHHLKPQDCLNQRNGGCLFRKRADWMARKCVVKVILSKEQKGILTELSTRLGTSDSEAMRLALMDYTKELSLMSEIIHMSKSRFNDTQPKE